MILPILIGCIIIAMICFIFGGLKRKFKPWKTNYKPIEKVELNPLEVELFDLINWHRKRLELPILKPEKLATEVCRKAILEDIEKGEKPSHVTWEKRIKDCKCDVGSEIIAMYYVNPLSAFSSYLRSQDHRSAIENHDRTHIGIGYTNNINYCILTKY